MRDIVGNTNNNTLKEIFNDKPMRDLRLDFIAGKEPKTCSRCFEQERMGQSSLRNHIDRNFGQHKDLIATTLQDGTVEDMRLVYWDFRFSNICNMKCRSCGPQLSSGWYEDEKKLNGRLPPDVPDRTIESNLWEDLLPHFDWVEEIYFAGGEPLIMEEHYRILNRLLELEKTDVRIRYNTNFSTMRYKKLDAIDAWSNFKNVEIGASLDGMGKQAEYIRSGTKWQQVLDNRERMKLKVPHANFYINCTVSVQNAYHIVDFYKWAVESDFIPYVDSFRINIVQNPLKLRMQMLPTHHKQALTKLYKETAEWAKTKGSNGLVVDQWESLINFLNDQDQPENLEQFKTYMGAIDNIRNESFAETFPEMRDLIE
jgi:sulfatase maturation enzyme AslB (radical SAM superfamily)